MERLSQVTALHVFGDTHEGMSGKHNEDSYGFFAWRLEDNQVLHLGVVADGVGGQIAGEIASRVTVDTIGDYFDRQESVNNISGHLEQAILAANEAVYNASQENPDYRGMSTTIAVAAVVENRLFTAHVGDSRIYFLRNGRLQQITTDHTWAQEAIEAGLLTREQAKTHPNRNVIKRHLGGKLQVEVDHRLVLEGSQTAEEAHANQGMSLKPGDTVLICSDGLTDMISDESVFDSLKNHFHDLGSAAPELVDKANQAGGRDNITVVIMQIPSKEGVVVAPTLLERKPADTVHEPTLITAAPKTAAVAAAVAAPPTNAALPSAAPPSAAPSNGPAVAMPTTKKSPKWKLPLLFIGGGGLLLLLVLSIGAFFLFVNDENGTPTTTVTTAPLIDPVTPSPSNTPGSPATAAFLATTNSEPENGELTPVGTSEEVPTLRPTTTPSSTPTRTPVPPPPLSTATLPIPTTPILPTATEDSPPPPPSSTPRTDDPTDEPPTPAPPPTATSTITAEDLPTNVPP